MQDAVVKGLSTDIPAYETVIFRTIIALPFLLGWLIYTGHATLMFGIHLWPLFLRSLILCSAYFAFVLSIAAMPIATSVSIYFTMPIFVAGFAGSTLGERVPLYRWVAIAAAFIGVLITVRPGLKDFEPAVFLALYSAFGYAWGQLLGRRLSHQVPLVIIANWQNFIYLGVGVIVGVIVHITGPTGGEDKALIFLTKPWSLPSPIQLSLLTFMGLMSVGAAVFFINAYRYAEANFVAPFEYSAIIWATLNGIIFFNDFPDAWNWLGTAIVILAGLYMLWNDRRQKTQI